MHMAAVAWFIFLNGLSFCWSFFNAFNSPDRIPGELHPAHVGQRLAAA
jgi:hypothetical protein